jgi:hypothetical protein
LDCFRGQNWVVEFHSGVYYRANPFKAPRKMQKKIFLTKERYLNWLDLSWHSPIDDIFGNVACQVLICTTQISFMYFLDVPKSVALDFLDKLKNGK